MSKAILSILSIFLFLSAFSFAARGPKQPLSDGSIHDLVERKLADDADVKGGGFTVEVKDGVVTLTGRVASEKQKQKAGKLAKKVNGVRSVVNDLRVERNK